MDVLEPPRAGTLGFRLPLLPDILDTFRPSLSGDPSMTTAQLAATVMAGRRTVQIRYHRDTELCDVTLARGDHVEDYLGWGFTEDAAELVAEVCAESRGLDVSRIDIGG